MVSGEERKTVKVMERSRLRSNGKKGWCYGGNKHVKVNSIEQ
jgi:hypothetical protein